MNSEAGENELLLQQVQKLEREIHFIKRWTMMAAVALLGLVVAFRASDRHRVSTQQVVAKDFVLVDAGGRARIRVAVLPQESGMGSSATAESALLTHIRCSGNCTEQIFPQKILDGLGFEQHAGDIIVLRRVADK